MNQTSKPFKDVNKKASRLTKIFQKIKKNPDFYDDTCKKWEQNCLDIPDQINKEKIRIAITGAVKSGKSTFINSIFQTDFLKRGAGVVTSVVTRIQKKDTLKAKFLIKSWDDINLEIKEAMQNFDDFCIDKNGHYDLRRKKDKKCLEKIYKELLNETSFDSNQIKPEMILFNNVLENYEFCKDFIKPDEFIHELKNDRFVEHKVFTGDPSKAFFVKDAKLEIDFGHFDSDIEIADCQGIDSTDTAQLLQVLEYLESSNLIIYLISSRTGIREADIKFFSIIDKMGIGENIVFVVNCDLSEHESLDDLKDIIKNVGHDIHYFTQNVNIYSFSSLYNLFIQDRLNILKKDEKRFQAWETDEDIIKYSNKETKSFFSDFQNRINQDRQNLILANPMQRLNVIAKGLQKKVSFFSNIFSDNENVAKKALIELKEMQISISKVQNLVENSTQKISKELKDEIDIKIENYFFLDKNSLIKKLSIFIKNYVRRFNKFEEQILAKGFPKALYLIFQDFKKELDIFLVKIIRPELVKFIQDLDKGIDDKAVSLYGAYKVDLFNLYKNFGEMPTDIATVINVKSTRKKLGIKPPSPVFTTRYNARIKISSFAGFGIHSLLMVLIKKVGTDSKFVKFIIFNKASLRFELEALKSIRIQIDRYKQKIQEMYFYPVIKSLSQEIEETIIDQFKIYSVEIDNIESKLKKEKVEKNKQKDLLAKISKDIEEIL